MKKIILSFALAAALMFGLSATVFAADSYVAYEGHNVFGFGPGSEYTETDLFDNFKGVMPGDVLEETVNVKNTASCCDFIKIYMRAEVHAEQINDLSDTVAQTETVAAMSNFLSQLSMRVWNGDELIFEASPDELDGLADNVYLGSLRKGENFSLRVELIVPDDLGNKYSYRAGEVDWVFSIEEYDDSHPDVPNTGDESHMLLYVILKGAAVCGIAGLLLAKRRKANS